MTDKSWVDRHRPESWEEIQGNTKDVEAIEKWIKNWSPGDEPQLLVGPPGTGKTSTAFVAANELEIPLNKVNLSLQRRTDELKSVARSTMSSPPDYDNQLVLLDEIDNMHGQVKKDALYDVLRDPKNPIIVTANDEYETPNPVTNACNVRKFSLGIRSRKAKIREIGKKENLDLSQADINKLAQRPDLRSAINDMQTFSQGEGEIGDDNRTWSEGEFSAVEALVKDDRETWRKSLDMNDDTFDTLGSAILWADDNLTMQYRGLEAGLAYQILASADFWLGRVWERQNFRYQKFGYELLKLLPEARLSEPYTGYINENMFPEWFRHSEDKHDGNSPEAQVYQKLKKERGYSFAGSFYEFKQRILPILKDLPGEERLEIIVNNSLTAEEAEVFGISEVEYEEYTGEDTVQEGEGWSPDTEQASATDW